MRPIPILIVLFLLVLVAVPMLLFVSAPPVTVGPSVPLGDAAFTRFNEGVPHLYRHQHDKAEPIFASLADEYPGEILPHINLAISQLNQNTDATIARALVTLEKALAIDPKSARAHYCRGIIHRHQGKNELAVDDFKRAIEAAPRDADAHYWYALTLRDLDRMTEALPHFEIAIAENPRLEGAWYNLFTCYRSDRNMEMAQKSLTQFQDLQASRRGVKRDIKYTEMGGLADGVTEWVPPTADATAPTVAFAPPVPLEGAAAPFAFVDRGRSCAVELWTAGDSAGAWSLGASPAASQPIPALRGATSFALGDFNEDRRVDIAIATADGVHVHAIDDSGKWSETQRMAATGVTSLRAVDLDLESDLDLLASTAVAPALAINTPQQSDGNGAFDGFGANPKLPTKPTFADLPGGSRLLVATDFDGDVDVDLLFLSPDGSLRMVQNAPQWRFATAGAELTLPNGEGAVTGAVSIDFDADGDPDLVVAAANALSAWTNDGRGRFTRVQKIADAASALHAVDLDLDGRLDLLATVGDATRVYLGAANASAPFRAIEANLPAATGFASADADGDGATDIALADPSGRVHFVRNTTDVTGRNSVRLFFGGDNQEPRYSNRLGIGARYEVRSGGRVQHGVFDGGLGASAQGYAAQVVGLGAGTKVDVVYIHWPDGVVQSELQVPVGVCHSIDEVQRKPESCPTLFAWDGKEYRFVTDFLGGGGLGIWVGIDHYEPFDFDETVRIAPEEYAVIDGEIRLSVMEPMEEVSYLDRISLRAVDHPGDVVVFPHELLAIHPEFAATGEALAVDTKKRAFPSRVTFEYADSEPRAAFNRAAGEAASERKPEPQLPNRRERILEIDRQYLDGFGTDQDLFGYADTHTTTLTFDDQLATDGDVRLFLHGWIEYPFSRTNFAAYHGARKQSPPTIQWRTGPEAEWQMLGEHIGIPAGFPKIMVVSIADAVAAGAREFRIDTDMEIYWDQIFAARVLPEERVKEHSVPLEESFLRYGGYPRWYSDDGAKPRTYHYHEREGDLDFKRFTGRATRFGVVDPLLETVDDEFVILATGDELTLRFDASQLPPLPKGWKRTLLLDTHGFCKSMDPLSASPTSIEPLPFSSMGSYPPPAGVEAPDRSAYVEEWNTRE